MKHYICRTYNWLRARVSRQHILFGVVIIGLLLCSALSLARLSPYRPNTGSVEFYRAKIVSITFTDQGQNQLVHVRILDGPDAGRSRTVTHSISLGDAAAQRLPVGSEVLLSKDKTNGNQYAFVSRWHMPGVAAIYVTLLLLVIVVGGWRGITSVLGLVISIAILAVFVVPQIVHGHNAFITCIEGAVLVTLASLYTAHGWSKRTTIALIASLLTLAGIVGITMLASYVTGTSEIITEENIGLLYTHPAIDIAGLLTGGIVIASLGTLFDITTGQAAAVDEIYMADHTTSRLKLFWSGMSVGREHVAALINTLALVYVGIALPSIVTTIVVNQQANYHAPFIVNANAEVIIEEIVRTGVASIGMLIAMPITTALAAYVLPRWKAGRQ